MAPDLIVDGAPGPTMLVSEQYFCDGGVVDGVSAVGPIFPEWPNIPFVDGPRSIAVGGHCDSLRS